MKIDKIHEKIKEYSRIAAYSEIKFSKEASSGAVGIWWFHRGEVIVKEDLPEKLPPDDLVCVEQEHIKIWPFAQNSYHKQFPEFLDMKYDDLERGRVWYEEKTKRFYITCSKEFQKNTAGIQAVKNRFGIENKSVIVRHDWQYDK